MAAYTHDIAVIGGGPGGYVAALRAAQLGARVALIEKQDLGGTCLNRGCIPTKALLKSAEVYRQVLKGGDFGVRVDGVTFDWAIALARKDDVVARLRDGVGMLLKARRVEVINGEGRLTEPHSISVVSAEGQKKAITAAKIIIATGSRPITLEKQGIAGPRIISTDQALALTELPRRWVIVGGGVIGLEFASLFGALGCQVTVIEALPTLAGGLDAEVTSFLASSLAKTGVRVITGARVTGSSEDKEGVTLTYMAGGQDDQVTADMVLVAVGRRVAVEELGLEACGVALRGGVIAVDKTMQSSVPGIYAIGDVVGGQMLAHVASAEGLIAAENACGHNAAIDYRTVPACIYSFPEVGSVGLSEGQAKQAGYATGTAKFSLAANGRALAGGESAGFVKIVYDRGDNTLLGAHFVGPYATELVAGAATAIGLEATLDELDRIIHAHPTVSEAFAEAVHRALGKPIHSL